MHSLQCANICQQYSVTCWQKDWSVYAQRCIVRCILVNPLSPFQDMSNPCYTLSFDGKQLALATYSHHFSTPTTCHAMPPPQPGDTFSRQRCWCRRGGCGVQRPWCNRNGGYLLWTKWWLEAIRNAGIYQMMDLFTKNHAFWNAKHGFYVFFSTQIYKNKISATKMRMWTQHLAPCSGLRPKSLGGAEWKTNRMQPKTAQAASKTCPIFPGIFEWDHHFSWINQLRSI